MANNYLHQGYPETRSGFFDLDFSSVYSGWQPGDAIYKASASPLPPGKAGGFKAFHDGSLLTLDCVHDASAIGLTAGWHTVTIQNVTMQRYLGYLRPPGVPLPLDSGGQAYVNDAAFELFAPTDPWQIGDQVVFFLSLPGSIRSPVAASDGVARDDRLSYPGRFSRDGLMRNEDGSAPGPTQTGLANIQGLGDTLNFFGDQAPLTAPGLAGSLTRCRSYGIYPIFGHIVFPFPNKQTTFEVQRILEFHRAVELMMASTTTTYRPSNVPIVTLGNLVSVPFGGSNGGELATWVTMFWPDRFHAAAAIVYPPSLRREIGEHAFWEMTMGMTGFDRSGSAYLLGDALQWNMFPVMMTEAKGLNLALGERYNLWDLSYLRRFQDGTMPRTVHFVPGDEDATTTGTDWVADVFGSWTSSGRTFVGASSAGSPEFVHSVADNRCHESGPYAHSGMPATPVSGQPVVTLPHILPEVAKEDAIPAHANNPIVATLPQVFEDLANRGLTPDDVYDPVMSHSPAFAGLPANSRAVGGTVPSGWLRLSQQPGWADQLSRPGKMDGAGTWLGREDTMLIRNQAVFVGSADGVVSKYVVDPATPPHEPLKLVAQSAVLGRWVSGLTHGTFGGNTWIICATYAHLFLLDPGTLQVQHSVPVSFDAFWPRRIALGDVDSTVAGNEIICPTYNGGILVFRAGGSGAPVEQLHWPEPGVADMAEINGEFVLLSHRGVVAKTRFWRDATGAIPYFPSGNFLGPNDQVAELLSASPAQEGIPLDLEKLNTANGTRVLALYRDNADAEKSLRIFEPANGAVVQTRWLVDSGPFASTERLSGDNSGSMYDIETTRYTPPAEDGSDEEGSAGDRIVLLSAGTLYLLDQHLNRVGERALGEFGPSLRAVDIAVGDLVSGTSANGYDDEVVIATQGGRLIWVPVADLDGLPTPRTLASSHPSYSSAGRNPAGGLGKDFRCNESTSASWGWVVDSTGINAFDQQASHWHAALDGTGGKSWTRFKVSFLGCCLRRHR